MAVFCLRRKHTANASEPAVRKKRMSEECTHDCSSCGAACSSRDAAPKHDAPNPNSSVKKVIGVVSGKGGVGKSMTSALLACAMARRGYHCGILDADITGPSIPKLFGIHGRAMADDKGCWPIQSRMGIDVMSINLLVENEEDPVPVCAGTDFRILGDHDAHGHGLIQRDAGILDLKDQIAADLADDRNGLANDKAKLCQVQTNFILTGDLLDGDGLTCFCHCQRHSTNTPLYAVWPAH